MAEGKKIEIRIAATGGQQAAAEVRKVESAVEDISPGAEKSADSMDELRQRMEEVATKAKDLKEESEQLNEEIANNNTRTRLAGAAMIGAAAGGAILSNRLGQIREEIEKIDIEALRQVDETLASEVQSLKELPSSAGEVLTSVLDEIQRFISGSTVSEAFAGLNEQLSLNVASQEAAVNRFTAASREMLARVNEASKDLARANSVLDAKDTADAKERDAEDAARIRAGEAPEDVRADRAEFDRKREIEKINRELEVKAADARAKREAAEQAKEDRDEVFRNQSTPEQRAKAALVANAADNQADESERDLQTAQSIAEQRRRGVNIQSDAKVSDAQGDKAARLKREQEQAEAKAQREKQQAEAKARRDQEAAARDAEQSATGRNRDLAGVGRDAVSLIPKGVSDKARAAVEAAAAKLNDGDQGGEVAALLQLVEQMAGYVERTQGKESANSIKIAQLEARIAALRNNGKK